MADNHRAPGALGERINDTYRTACIMSYHVCFRYASKIHVGVLSTWAPWLSHYTSNHCWVPASELQTFIEEHPAGGVYTAMFALQCSGSGGMRWPPPRPTPYDVVRSIIQPRFIASIWLYPSHMIDVLASTREVAACRPDLTAFGKSLRSYAGSFRLLRRAMLTTASSGTQGTALPALHSMHEST